MSMVITPVFILTFIFPLLIEQLYKGVYYTPAAKYLTVCHYLLRDTQRTLVILGNYLKVIF